ncbi:MAG TPA: alpha/beta hydrolase [Longimicrobium sp.]|uniref:alpha/beta hydrolase n=1 Tax=Longimicrobium sp. TaxID=2029185 RepID=UPI002ED7D2ED
MLPRSTTRCLAFCAALAAAPAAAQAPVFQERPCEPAIEGARCGTVQVPENRDAPGRMLALNVVVFPARTAAPAREALASFGGGPGQAATESADYLAVRFAALRDDRDLLFVDQRGTGRSAPLQCPLRDPADPQTYLGDYLPPGPVARCLEDLSRGADLTRYGYLELAHDVEAVRTALGYDRMDLWGGSYGTRAAQVYMRAYPRSVRSAVLEGVVPTGYAQPAGYARSMDAALAGLARDCRADAACGAAFPDVAGQARTVADRLARSPGTAEIVDPETGARLRLTVTRATFADLLRRMLYAPDAAAQIPYVVDRAHQGDVRPAARLALQDRRGYARGLYWGLNLAITCTEDVPFVDAAAEARDNGRTLLGDWRTRQQVAACAGWPRYPLPAGYHQPVPSDVPTLLISGELDPVTPPSGGEAAAAYLRSSLHVVVPSAGHTYQGMPGAACVDSLVIRFYRQASVRGLDASCVRDVRRPPFVITVAEPIALDQAALQRFAGSYAAAGPPPVQLRAEALDGVLRITFDGGFTVIASPIAPTVFRLEGLPPRFVLRFAEDGRSVLIPTGEGDETATLARTP